MKVAVTAQGADIEAATSPIFGRCPYFVFVDSDTMAFEAVPNQSAAAGGGAGIQAAQFVVQSGAQAVISVNVGPNAFAVLSSAGIDVYRADGGTVAEAVAAFKEGKLSALGGASTRAHSGMR